MSHDLTAGDPTIPPDNDPPVRRIRPVFLRAVAVALLVAFPIFAALLVAAWVWRLPVSNLILPRALEIILDAPVTLQVARIDGDQIVIEDIRIQDGPAIRQIRIAPAPDDATSIMDELVLQDVQLDIAIAEDGSTTIRGLEALLKSDPTATPTSDPIHLPFRKLVLNGLSIIAETPVGRQYLTGDATLSLPNAPQLYPVNGTLTLNAPDANSAVLIDMAIGDSGIALGADIDLSLAHWLPFAPGVTRAQGRATASLDLASGSFDDIGQIAADPVSLLAVLSGTATLSWTGATITATDGVTATDWPTAHAADGSAELLVEGGQALLSLPSPIEIETDGVPAFLTASLPPMLAPYAEGRPQVVIAQDGTVPAAVLRPDRDDGWQLAFGAIASMTLGPISARIEPDALTLSRELQPTRLSLASASIDLLRGLDLPRDVSAHLQAGPVTLDAGFLSTGIAEAPVTLPYSVEATVFGDIAPPLYARSTALSVQGTARLRSDPQRGVQGVDVSVAPGGRLQVEGLTGTGDIRLSPRLRLDVAGRDPMRVGFDFDDPAATLSLEGAFRLGGLSLALPGDSGGLAFSLDRQPVSIRYNRNGVSLALGPVDVTETSTTAGLSRAVLRADFAGAPGRQTGTVTLTANGLSFDGKPVLPGGMSVNAAIAQTADGGMTIEGPVALADGAISANATIRTTGDGDSRTDISVATAPIRFGPGQLALSDVVPPGILDSLPYIPALNGGLGLALDASISNGQTSGTLTVSIDNMAAVTPSATVDTINGSIGFDLAQVPATLGEQALTARIRIPGLDPIPMNARFTVTQDAKVQIPELSLKLFGVGPSLVDTVIDPSTNSLDGILKIRRMDLAQSLALLDIAGVAGTGTISGLMPLHISPDNAIIEEGTLAAEGNGRLQIDNETINQALASDQEAVQLLTTAIKDFRYDSLSATVNLPPNGNGVIGLSISGNNPAVLEGHPFALNINLESDFRKLFGVLQDILAMSSAVLGGVSVSSP